MLKRKQLLQQVENFGKNNFSGKGERAEDTPSASRAHLRTHRRMVSLPPRMAAAHIRNTNRHTWSRWLSKNKGFYQFVCYLSTIDLCNVSSHSSTLLLKRFPFALTSPGTFMVGTHSASCSAMLTPSQEGSSYQHRRKSKTYT